MSTCWITRGMIVGMGSKSCPHPGAKIKAMVERIAVDRIQAGRRRVRALGDRVARRCGAAAALGGAGLGGLTMSEDGGLEEVEESFLAAASCSLRRATVPSSTFKRASWASNSPAGADSSGKTSVPWVS